MTDTTFDESKHIEEIAEKILEYVNNPKNGIEYKISQEQKDAYDECCSKYKELYGSNALKSLTDDNLLDFMFSNTSKPKDDRKFNLFSTLANHEGNKGIEYWSNFESLANLITIVGGDWPKGSVGNVIHPEQMGIYCDENGKWKNWNHKEISYEEALVIGKEVRDALVSYCEAVEDLNLKPITLESYKLLDGKFKDYSIQIDDNLMKSFGKDNKLFFSKKSKGKLSAFNFYRKIVWIHKYLSMMYDKEFCTFHSLSKYVNTLSDLGFTVDKKTDNYYSQDGIFVLIQKAMNLHCLEFDAIARSIILDNKHIKNDVLKELGLPIKSNDDSNNKGENVMINKDSKQPNKPQNRILFGAPGTGKSYKLNEELKNLKNYDFERVTFHPDYTYANFVGTYKPIETNNISIDDKTKKALQILQNKGLTPQEKYDALYESFRDDKNLTRLPILVSFATDSIEYKIKLKDGSEDTGKVSQNHGIALRSIFKFINEDAEKISYKYIPGPFMRLYVKALKNPDKPHILIIEEINRANTAAVFGDLFQLLDRKDDGSSEYPIQASEDQKLYLEEQLSKDQQDINNRMSTENNPFDCISQIKLPNNMYIWATMNSADQGVFYLDTAFKRRWTFEYIGVDEGEDQIENFYYEYTKDHETYYKVNWNCLRKAINDFLVEQNVNEDKLLGTFFLNPSSITKDDQIDKEKFNQLFKNKILMYLFEDAARHKRVDLFAGCKDEQNRKLFSRICKEFDTKNIEIFNEEIWNKENVRNEIKSNDESNSNSSESLE